MVKIWTKDIGDYQVLNAFSARLCETWKVHLQQKFGICFFDRSILQDWQYTYTLRQVPYVEMRKFKTLPNYAVLKVLNLTTTTQFTIRLLSAKLFQLLERKRTNCVNEDCQKPPRASKNRCNHMRTSIGPYLRLLIVSASFIWKTVYAKLIAKFKKMFRSNIKVLW